MRRALVFMMLFLIASPSLSHANCGFYLVGATRATETISYNSGGNIIFSGQNNNPFPQVFNAGVLDSNFSPISQIKDYQNMIINTSIAYKERGTLIRTAHAGQAGGWTSPEPSAALIVQDELGNIISSNKLDFGTSPNEYAEEITALYYDETSNQLYIGGSKTNRTTYIKDFFIGRIGLIKNQFIFKELKLPPYLYPIFGVGTFISSSFIINSVAKDRYGIIFTLSPWYGISPIPPPAPGTIIPGYIVSLSNSLQFKNAFSLADRRPHRQDTSNSFRGITISNDDIYILSDIIAAPSPTVGNTFSYILRARRDSVDPAKIQLIDTTKFTDPALFYAPLWNASSLVVDQNSNVYLAANLNLLKLNYTAMSGPPTILNQKNYTDAVAVAPFSRAEIDDLIIDPTQTKLAISINSGLNPVDFKSFIIGSIQTGTLTTPCMNARTANYSPTTVDIIDPASELLILPATFSINTLVFRVTKFTPITTQSTLPKFSF